MVFPVKYTWYVYLGITDPVEPGCTSVPHDLSQVLQHGQGRLFRGVGQMEKELYRLGKGPTGFVSGAA